MNKVYAPESLIALAAAVLRDDVLADFAPEKRQRCLDVTKLLEIAGRQVADAGDESLWKLLDRVYDDGEGSAAQLGRDIRAGAVNDTETQGLRDALKRIVIAELKVRNPAFLASRNVKS
jgi:Domain of unknown function (DUF6285)